MNENETLPDEPLKSPRNKESPEKLVSEKAFTTSEKFIPITEFETQAETLPSPSNNVI